MRPGVTEWGGSWLDTHEDWQLSLSAPRLARSGVATATRVYAPVRLRADDRCPTTAEAFSKEHAELSLASPCSGVETATFVYVATPPRTDDTRAGVWVPEASAIV